MAAWYIMSHYNNLVELQENTRTAWSNVETQYERRSDLIPQLVATVKGAADFEQTTLTQVVEARASATKTTVNIEDADSIAQFQAAQWEVTSALSRLLVTVEAYPELKANINFTTLQAQLEGTENRIAVARKDYNTVAEVYRKTVRKIPTALYAKLLGFGSVELFEASEGSEKAPEINFDFNAE